MHVKKGDKVIVRIGKDAGKEGTILRAFPKKGMVLIEGVNVKTKHARARRRDEKGQIAKIAFPISVSNVKKIS